MANDDSHSPLVVLADSLHRREILILLRESKTPLTNATLTDRSSAGRATVRRAIEQLGDKQWIHRTASRASGLSVAGHLVLRAYETFCEQASEDIFVFLTHSPTRVQTLRYLDEKTQTDEQNDDNTENYQYYQSADIAESVTGDRSTVTRSLRGCTDRGWILKGKHARYALTPTGRQIIQLYTDLDTSVSWVTANAGGLNQFSQHADSRCRSAIVSNLPLAPLTGEVTAVKAKHADPDAPFLYYKKQLTAVQPAALRGMLPAVSFQADMMRQLLAELNTEIELIMDDAAIAAARRSFPEQFATLRNDERATLLKHPELSGVGLTLFNKRAVLGAYDDEGGHLQTILSSTADSFVTYAAGVYDMYYRQSDPLDKKQTDY